MKKCYNFYYIIRLIKMQNQELLETWLFKNRLNQTSVIDLFKLFSSDTIDAIYRDLTTNFEPTEKISETDSVLVFTDGGCVNNGKPGARAAYSVYFKDFPQLDSSNHLKENPTNQRAELSAIYTAIKIIEENQNLFHDKNIIIYTDSSYSIKCITQWYKSWKRNDWKTANGKPVKNKELIENICKKLESIGSKIQFKHVFSHTTEPKNKSRDSIEYQIWLGNKIVDENVQRLNK